MTLRSRIGRGAPAACAPDPKNDQRFEHDPRINVKGKDLGGDWFLPYLGANAHPSSYQHNPGAVTVTYIAHQRDRKVISRADAEKYLAWLDAGNIGKHYQCPGLGPEVQRMLYGRAAEAHRQRLELEAKPEEERRRVTIAT